MIRHKWSKIGPSYLFFKHGDLSFLLCFLKQGSVGNIQRKFKKSFHNFLFSEEHLTSPYLTSLPCVAWDFMQCVGMPLDKVSLRLPLLRLSLHMSQVAHQAGAYPSFRSMKQLGIFLLLPGWDASPSQSYPQHETYWYPFVHLDRERHCQSQVSYPRNTTQCSHPGPLNHHGSTKPAN